MKQRWLKTEVTTAQAAHAQGGCSKSPLLLLLGVVTPHSAAFQSSNSPFLLLFRAVIPNSCSFPELSAPQGLSRSCWWQEGDVAAQLMGIPKNPD